MESNQKNTNRSAGKIIGELSRAAHVYFHSEFKSLCIGHAQVKTLLHISNNRGISPQELAKSLRLDKSSITSQLQILEKNGYIIKQRSEEDARRQEIILSEKTNEILTPLKKVFKSWTDTLLEGFNENEKGELFEYLIRMQKNAQTKVDQIKIKK